MDEISRLLRVEYCTVCSKCTLSKTIAENVWHTRNFDIKDAIGSRACRKRLIRHH